jgi:predicted nucleic acid-binding Zn ribbon protein
MTQTNRKAPIPLSASLRKLFRSLGIEEKIERSRVIADWSEFVGERIAEIAQPQRLDGTTLYVRVSSDAWRNELMLMKNSILTKIRERYGRQVIEEIRFV